MNRSLFLTLFVSGLVIIAAGCLDNDKWERQERKQIDDFLEKLGDTVVVLKPSGLYYIELEEGAGSLPADYDTVWFKYKSYFLDYVKWDENDPVSVPYKHVMGTETGPVIEGVDEGLRYIRAGGTAKLITPSSLAFGHSGLWQYVPGYTPLLWFIQLDSVRAGPGK